MFHPLPFLCNPLLLTWSFSSSPLLRPRCLEQLVHSPPPTLPSLSASSFATRQDNKNSRFSASRAEPQLPSLASCKGHRICRPTAYFLLLSDFELQLLHARAHNGFNLCKATSTPFSFFFADTGQLTGCRSSTKLRLKARREVSKSRHLFWGRSILASYDKEDRKRDWTKKKRRSKEKNNPKTWREGKREACALLKNIACLIPCFFSFLFDSPQAAHRIIAAGVISDY